MATALPVAAVVGGGIKLGHRVRVPWWGSIGGIMIGAGYLVLRDVDRRAAVVKRTNPWTTALLHLLAEAQRQEQEGTAGLHGLMFQPAGRTTTKCEIARVLARMREPMTVAEMQSELGRHCEIMPTTAEIRSVLESCREFVESPRHRWNLGRASGPWSRAL